MMKHKHPTKEGQLVRVIQSGRKSLGDTLWVVEAIADPYCDIREHNDKKHYATHTFPRDMLAVVTGVKL